jgi:hypothetical protein
MTTTDPAPAPAGHHEAQIPDPGPSNYLDYAVEQYGRLAEQPPPMPMDVHIAALIGNGDETRANTVALSGLTIAINRMASALEALLADPTAVIRAGLAATQQQGGRFGLEESEDTQLAVEEGTP